MQSVDIVVPVYNEVATVARSIRALHAFCRAHVDGRWRIVIADNASVDGTLPAARELARELTGVEVIHLREKGRGRALRRAWTESDADLRCYMDVDLSTDLAHLPPLLDGLRGGHDIAVGSRLMRGSRTTRSVLRTFLSRGYNALLALSLSTRLTDAQCGFKAVTRRVAEELVPQVRSDRWFFDTELLILAERAGLRIFELPVRWIEDEDSRVKIHEALIEDIAGIVELRRRLARHGAPRWGPEGDD